ncbi:MAG: single-stranded-DNA-specific exonuclease RecJ [Clostridia bacterium]|nr:single-stranded-DNA-specific exonuclease RecJ [Clostridia bacterium]
MRNIHPVITELLRQRGLVTEEDIQEFLSAKPQRMYDPFLLFNMKAGVDLIVSTLKENGRICVYGDYDADGITATTLMIDALGTVTENLFYYIPSRFEEGYGLNKEAIDQIYQDGCNLIITVDCGSVAHDEVEYIKSLGMKVLVTDHHSLDEMKADCVLINPKQKECQYPFKELAGCAVAFKLVHALVIEGIIQREVLTRSLDLVAIGTIGDVVPLVDENRAFVKYGIRSINMGLRPGLRELVKRVLPRQQALVSDNISFAIVPHLNACGRMEDASIAVELLRYNSGDVDRVVDKIIKTNDIRKKTQNQAYEECIKIVEESHLEDSFIVIRADDIHEGIAGIVAGKVKEYYHKPAIIVTKSGENFKGTGRSVEGLDLYQLLSKHQDLFVRYGGHKGACGFTIEEDKLGKLRQVLIDEMDGATIQEAKKDRWDLELRLEDITMDLAKGLEDMAPFGNKNPKPAFLLKDVKIEGLRYMGDGKQHARFMAGSLSCILFNKAQELDLERIDRADIIGCVEIQNWNGNSRLQLIVEEIN